MADALSETTIELVKKTVPALEAQGTAVTDRWALAVLENFQGDVPDVLRQYGAPPRVEPN